MSTKRDPPAALSATTTQVEEDNPPPDASRSGVLPAVKILHREPETHVDPPTRPNSDPPRPKRNVTSHVDSKGTAPTDSGVQTILSKFSLLDRFIPESIVVAPPAITPLFRAQQVWNALHIYYMWRFTNIALGENGSIQLQAAIPNAARRIATTTLCAIVNKLIHANRENGMQTNGLNAAIPPTKGYMMPGVSIAVINAIGKTCPHWSGDTFYIPSLNNQVPPVQDDTGNAIPNIHVFNGSMVADLTVQKFCQVGNITMRSTDFKIPGGEPYWLAVTTDANERYSTTVMNTIHPDNFDPATTVLSTLCSCTNATAVLCNYQIMKGIPRDVAYAILVAAYE